MVEGARNAAFLSGTTIITTTPVAIITLAALLIIHRPLNIPSSRNVYFPLVYWFKVE